MLVPQELYQKLCPQYQLAIDKLEDQLKMLTFDTDEQSHQSKEPPEKLKIFDQFSGKYFMIRDLWEKKIELCNPWSHLDYYSTTKVPAYHFYYMMEHPRFVKLLKPKFEKWSFDTRDNLPIRLNYPNNQLDVCYMMFEESQRDFPGNKTKKRTQYLKKVYSEITSVENDETQWLKALIAVNDEEFVRHNVEHRLNNDPTNKKLWKLYLDYLETAKNFKELLQVYSKYCRLFLDDEDMKDVYRKAAEKYGPPKVFWSNLFDFEKEGDQEISDESKTRSKKSLTPPFIPPDNATPKSQKLLILSPYLQYIMSKANPAILHKLQKTCKFFFHLYPHPICYRLTIFTHYCSGYFENSLVVRYAIRKQFQFSPFHLTTCLRHDVGDKAPLALSKFLRQNKIYKSDIKFLEICRQTLTKTELEFLIGHGNLESLELRRTTVKNENNRELFLEEILAMTPKLRSLEIYTPKIQTPQIFENLVFLQNKVLKFKLDYGIRGRIEPEPLCQFLKTHANPLAKFSFSFWGSRMSLESFNHFESMITELLNQWKPEDEKPEISLYRSDLN